MTIFILKKSPKGNHFFFYFSAETKPIKISSSSNRNNNMIKERPEILKQSPSSFVDVRVNDSDDSLDSPPIQYEYSPQSKTSNSTVSHHKNNVHHIPEQDNINQEMLLDSMIEDAHDDQIDNNRAMRKPNRLSHKFQSNTESNDVFLLLDGDEHLTVCYFYSL
jgi:hypothetical protein